ncbi:uncharacterized protein LOC114574147 [Exaiptasia diaphana]|uniref:Uncharacterized protein n=1 Tax=Exaiptasia diaphana TaxID=2652724 RepID=A0A913YIR4_EXADI|nr:uncharacterized protein LOC114574147 [Exaiptasia diaphana]
MEDRTKIKLDEHNEEDEALDDEIKKLQSESKGICGYIQNVSPIKQNDKQFKWFDCELQFEKGIVRAVSFDTSSQVRTKFTDAAKAKAPVKLTNFKIGSKRPGKHLDIIVRKETRLEEVDNIPFPFKPSPTALQVQIGNLNMFRASQLLSITALVSNIQPKKDVTKKSNKQIVSLQECQLTDPTGNIKLVLWEEFVDRCESGKTYIFHNLQLKTDYSQKSLSTSLHGCTITETTPFPDLIAPQELPSTTTSNQVQVYGVSQITSYTACSTCLKKVQEHPTNNSLVKCTTCRLTLNKKRCLTQYCAKLVFECIDNENKKLSLTCFHDTLDKMLEKYNIQENAHESLQSITIDKLEEALSSIDAINISYNFTNSKVLSIQN